MSTIIKTKSTTATAISISDMTFDASTFIETEFNQIASYFIEENDILNHFKQQVENVRKKRSVSILSFIIKYCTNVLFQQNFHDKFPTRDSIIKLLHDRLYVPQMEAIDKYNDLL